MRTVRKKIFFVSFIFAVSIFLAHFFLVKTAVYGDGRYYFSYLPVFLIERSFDFSKSFQFYGLPFIYTPLHFLQNPHTVGPALVWSIPYLVGFYFFTLFGNFSPYNPHLQILPGIFSVSLVFFGLFFLYKSLEKYFSTNIAFLTTLTIFFATNLFFYGALDVLNSHSVSFFFAALSVYLWLSKTSGRNSILLGLSIGMLILIRNQDAVFIFLPLLKDFKLKNLYYFLITLITIFITNIPQFLLWQITWGNLLKSPYFYSHNIFHFLNPNFIGVLFNFYDGFFTWTPITVLAVVGIFIFLSKNKNIGIPLLLVFLADLYILAIWNTWWAGASFSARILISTLPILAFGLAQFYKKFFSFKKQILSSVIFSVLNMALIIFFLTKVR